MNVSRHVNNLTKTSSGRHTCNSVNPGSAMGRNSWTQLQGKFQKCIHVIAEIMDMKYSIQIPESYTIWSKNND